MPPEQLAEKALAQVAVRASTDRDGAPSGAPDASLPPSPILLPSDATKVTEAAEATEPAPPTRTASVLEALGALSPRALLGYGASNADASSAGGNGDGANGGTEEAPLEPLGVYRDSTQARREELNVPAAPPASEEDGSSGSWSCSIGIATGQAFCGVVGSKSRHEYTVMGDCVNLAARLMAHAGKEKLGVLADVVTYRKSDAKKLDTTRLTETTRVERRVEYTTLDAVKMKGKADLIQIFKPEKMVFKGGVERKMIEHNGRAEELAKLRKMFAMLHTYGAGGLIILNGERGSGKGELVKSLANAGKTTCMQVLTGKEDSAKKVGAGEAVELPDVHVSPEDEEILERAPAFAAWHQVFEKALKLVVTKRLGTDGAKSATPSTLRSTEAKVVRELLEAHVVTSPTHLGYLHELNAVFGRVVVPAPRGYQPPQASTRARETAQLAVALLTEIAKDFHLLILLHIVTSSNTSVALSMDSWKVANHVARAAAQRKPPDKTLMLVIVSRSTMFSTNNADVEEIVSLASDYLDPIVPFADEKRILVLDPLNERRRTNYLFELLRKNYAPKLDPAGVPDQLVEYVSEVAGGVPLQIEEVVHALIKQKKVHFVAPESSEDGVARCHCADADELADPARTEIPHKIINAAERFYSGLPGRHQLIVKLISPLESFSINMVTSMLAEHVKMGGAELTNKGLLLEMKDLVQQGVFIEVPPTAYILEHDLCPTEGYAFVNKLMQRQVANIMLQRERDNISEHMAELQRATAAHRKKEADEALLAEQNKLEVVKVALGSHGAHSKARSKRMSLASRVASRSASSKRSAAAELVGGGAGDTSTVREATRVPTPKSKARSIRNRFRFGKSSKSSAETVAVVQVDLQSADPSAAQHE